MVELSPRMYARRKLRDVEAFSEARDLLATDCALIAQMGIDVAEVVGAYRSQDQSTVFEFILCEDRVVCMHGTTHSDIRYEDIARVENASGQMKDTEESILVITSVDGANTFLKADGINSFSGAKDAFTIKSFLEFVMTNSLEAE